MASSLGNHGIVNGSGGFNTVTLATVTAGSTLAACWSGNAARTPAFSDDVNGAWTAINFGGASQDLAWGYFVNSAGGSIDVSFNSAGSAGYMFVALEILGGGAFDAVVADINTNVGTTTPISQALATAGSGIVIGGLNLGGSASTITPNNASAVPTTGWATVDEDETAAAGTGGSVIWQAFAASGTQTPGWTLGTSLNTSAIAIAFLDAVVTTKTFLLH